MQTVDASIHVTYAAGLMNDNHHVFWCFVTDVTLHSSNDRCTEHFVAAGLVLESTNDTDSQEPFEGFD